MTITGWIVLSKGARAEVLTLGTSEHYLIWEQGLWRLSPVFMRSRGWTPVHYDVSSQGDVSTQRQKRTERRQCEDWEGERPVKTKARIGGLRLQATEHQRNLANTRRLERGVEQASEGTSPARALNSDVQPPNCDTTHFHCLTHPVRGALM